MHVCQDVTPRKKHHQVQSTAVGDVLCGVQTLTVSDNLAAMITFKVKDCD